MTEEPPSAKDSNTLSERPKSSVPLLVLVFGLCGLLLYVAQSVFIPIALAVLFALVLSSPVEALHRLGLPRSLSAILILVVFLGLVGVAVNQLWSPAQQWLAGAPRTVRIISQKLGPMARVMHRIQVVSDRAGHLTDAGSATPPAPPKEAPTPSASGGLLVETRTALVATMTVIILTLFFLAGARLCLRE